MPAGRVRCPSCGEPVARPERKIVAVLFSDLSGFTAISSALDPEEVHGFLRPTMQAIARIVEEFGGTVLQTMGDGVFGAFGVPTGHEDAAERAVRAAIAIRDRVRASPDMPGGLPPLEVHSGVNVGEVFVSPLSEPPGFTVIGDAVNVAARLADLAPPGTILAGERLRDLTDHAIRFGPRRKRRLKGKAGQVATYEVQGFLKELPAGRRPSVREEAFVGRDAVLDRLREEMDVSEKEGRSRVLVVTGDPGIGKSRLADEFRTRLGEATVLPGRCAPYGERVPLSALVNAVGEFAGVAPGTAREIAADRVLALAERFAAPDDAAALARRIHALLGGEPSAEAVAPSVHDVAAAARTVVEALARSGSVLVVLDDLQWADPDLLHLLGEVHGAPWRGAILFLGLARPEPLPLPVPQVALDALGADDMRSLVTAIVGKGFPPAATQRLIDRSGGNPLFLEESIRMLAEAGAIAALDGGYRVVDRDRLDLVPSSLQLLVVARLDGLGAEEKRVLQVASVAGEVIWDALVARIAGDDAVRILPGLEQRDLLRRRSRSVMPGTVEFEFKHVVIRDVAYESVPRAERATRHLQVAEWLREVSPSLPEEPIAALAHHYEQAWYLSRGAPRGGVDDTEVAALAATYLKRSADRAIARQARLAEALYSRAVELATSAQDLVGPSVAAEALLGRAQSLVELGRPTAALGDAREAHTLALRTARTDLRARARLVQARAESELGNVERAQILLEEALTGFEISGDVRGQAETLHRISETWRFGDHRQQVDYLRRAYDRFVDAGDPTGRALLAQDLALLLTMRGGAEFLDRFEEAVRMVGDEGDLRSRAATLRTWAYYAWYRGDVADALRTAIEARPIAAEAGARLVEADALLLEALATSVTGPPAEAEQLAGIIVTTAAEMNAPVLRALGLAAGVRPALRSGRHLLATRRLRSAREILQEVGVPVQMLEVDLAEAWLALDRGAWDRVHEPARRWSGGGSALGWRLYEPNGFLLVGRAHLGEGRLEEAIATLERAVSSARKIDAVGTLAGAQAALEQARLLAGQPFERLKPAAGRATPDAVAIRRENAGLLAFSRGRHDDAIAAFANAVELWQRVGVTSWLARAHAFHARALQAAGDEERASEAMTRCEKVIGAIGTPERWRASIRALAG